MEYSPEEMLELVMELSRKYTSNDSTSVKIEVVEQLITAVEYCISELFQSQDRMETSVPVGAFPSLNVCYHRGYELVFEKTKRAKVLFDRIAAEFRSFGNKGYYDTIVKGMPAFFLTYDIKFNPQDTILTLDYPLLIYPQEKSGIDAIYDYLSCTLYEQIFLIGLPEQFVLEVLSYHCSSYKEYFINLCSVVLRNMLGHMLIGEDASSVIFSEYSFESLEKLIRDSSEEELFTQLKSELQLLLQKGYQGDIELLQYFSLDLKDFCMELKHGEQLNTLPFVFIIYD